MDICPPPRMQKHQIQSLKLWALKNLSCVREINKGDGGGKTSTDAGETSLGKISSGRNVQGGKCPICGRNVQREKRKEANVLLPTEAPAIIA